MIKCGNWPVGVCSWSVTDDLNTLAKLKEQLGMEHINLNTCPVLEDRNRKYIDIIQQQGWNITATMVAFAQEDYSTLEAIKATGGIIPDDYWETNRKRVFDAIDLTAAAGVKYMAFHFGFIDLAESSHSQKCYDRANILADQAADKNVQLLLETGQESASELLEFLEKLDHPAIAINFDPANMILYDKDNPIDALETLSRWVKHVHIKDALRTKEPGTWGLEVPWSGGQVGGDDFLTALKKTNFTGALAIEREAGPNRFDDIKNAVEILTGYSA